MTSQTTYVYQDRDLTLDELRQEVEAHVGEMDSSLWIDGEFDFDDWLANSLVAGNVTKLHSEK
ncbi:MAG: hypothetical protein K0R68_2573 [Mycobacterium sp.]|nr:hypothetical protein [Mycobacterium sp.]